MMLAKLNNTSSIVSNNSISKKSDSKNKKFVENELIPNNNGNPQQNECVKQVNTKKYDE